MLNALYIASALSGLGMAAYHAHLIRQDRSVRHGVWMAVWFVAGVATATMGLHHIGWAVMALFGMAAVFSAVFRTTLNKLRGLPWSYMGPDLTDTSAKRSQYDLLCWRIAARLGWQPVAVALVLELSTAVLVATLMPLRG